ncbi:MAG: hypothetical protein ACK4UN_09885 [Limisphaerales bacterium]
MKINQANVLLPAAASDLHRGADGKWYLSQHCSVGGEAGVVVLDANGSTLFSSLAASRTLLENPTANDILRNVQGVAVSEDQKWLAAILNNSYVAVVPLVNGIPDLANRLVVNTQQEINSGRDIAFDAAGNIHYVSSGQARYRVLSPGGHTVATTSWNGASYSFSIGSPAMSLAVERDGNQVRLEWSNGVLQESTSVEGGWQDSAIQTSPQCVYPIGSMKVFRLRQ